MVNVGILYNVCPRDDNIMIYQDRLKKYLSGVEHEDFLVRKQILQIGEKRHIIKTHVFMIVADRSNEESVNEAFEKLDDQDLISYMTWEEYRNLKDLQKKTFIEKQDKHLDENKCILIKGFIDNKNNIPLVYQEEHDSLEGMMVDDGKTDF